VVEGHSTCTRCGYDLYTQATHSACPECGRPVRVSLDCTQRHGRGSFASGGRRSRGPVAWRGWWGPDQRGAGARCRWLTRKRRGGHRWPRRCGSWLRRRFGRSSASCLRNRVGWEHAPLRNGCHPTYPKPLVVRVLYLACYCLPWVLAGWAAWKLGDREYVRPRFRQDPRRYWRGVRPLAVAWFVAPALVNPWEYGPNEQFFWLFGLAAPMTLLVFGRAARVARRAGRPVLGGHCAVLGWIACLAACGMTFLALSAIGGRTRWWADEVFMFAPTPTGSGMWFAAEVGRAFADERSGWLGGWAVLPPLVVAITAWQVAALVVVARLLRRPPPPRARKSVSSHYTVSVARNAPR
jgi:hypothetical protein